MKIKFISIFTLILGIACHSLFAQTKPKTTNKIAPKTKPKVALTFSKVPVKEFSSAVDSVSYAVGVLVAQNFKSQKVVLNPEMVAKGFEAATMGGTLKMNEQLCQSIVQTYMMKNQEAQALEQSKQFLPNKAEGEKFLAENKVKPGVVTLPSGLQYIIIKAGEGDKPLATDKVKTHYHGTLIDGQVFDSSVDRGEPITFPVNGVIPGWIEALQLMPVGSKWKLFIPYNLAYGTRPAGDKIKPYSALVFDVELISIEK
jgi:FKBP-type peptidyl-prolyl cis-trans isomerase FklB